MLSMSCVASDMLFKDSVLSFGPLAAEDVRDRWRAGRSFVICLARLGSKCSMSRSRQGSKEPGPAGGPVVLDVQRKGDGGSTADDLVAVDHADVAGIFAVVAVV